MKLFKNGYGLHDELFDYISKGTNIFIFVPYIKLPQLKHLLDNNNACKAIIVRWDTTDLLLGSSDLEIYNYCKEKSIQLFRNRRLHLKAFVENYKTCFFGSANISARALNHPPSENYNYEFGSIIEDLLFEDRYYLNIIIDESTLVTDSIYNQILEQIPIKKKEFPAETDFELRLISPDKDFLISSLPMSTSVKTLQRVYLEKKAIHEEELNCALHDLALYKIPLGLNEFDFCVTLKNSFFEHPFIKKFIQMVQMNNGEVYFGQAKMWIQNNCADVPLPRRWEITENLQILFKWLRELGEDIFDVDRPNYSERLHFRKD